MKSSGLGTGTSKVEVVNISENGIRLYVRGKEHFLSYREFPWFKDARLSEIQRVEWVRGRHLRWKRLDVDLDLDSIEHPERYPLKYR